MEYIYLLVTLFYAMLIMQFASGWIKTPKFKINRKYVPKTMVSVIVPFKNEKENIVKLFDSLKTQSFPNENVHYYFVNDHSTDGGELILLNFVEANKNMSLLHSNKMGKKNALAYVYKKAKGDLIVTLDADCEVGSDWLMAIVQYYEKFNKKLIINPVVLKPTNTVWKKIQAVEFQSLIVSGAGAAESGMPIMCNGANLAFSRELLNKGDAFLNHSKASGDDMFLLEYVKKNYKNAIGFLKSQDAIAYTNTVSWITFLHQRARWTSKSTDYKDKHIVLTALVVFFINILLVSGLLIVFFNPNFYPTLLFCFSVKFLIDAFILIISSFFFKNFKNLWVVVIIALFYPFYVVLSAFNGLLGNFKWK